MNRVIALGFFDGVHLGHGALLRAAVRAAAEQGHTPAAVTFDLQPEAVLTGRSAGLINSLDDRVGLMARLYGISDVLTLPFDDALRRMDWRDFVTEVLIGLHHGVHLIAGYDFRFGHRGEGTPARLAALCAELGLGCDIIAAVEQDGAPISSSRIRALLTAGDCAGAARLLGHPHVLSGPVTHGRRLGGTLGFPTANLAIPPGVLCPAHGVYAARAHLSGGETFPSVVNIGVRPTVNAGGDVTVEAHLSGFSGDLYGQPLRLELERYLRPERRFDDMDALRKQIAADLVETIAYFG